MATDDRVVPSSDDGTVPSVWAVVSAYLHTGTAASDAAPAPVDEATPGDRIAQVRGIFARTDTTAMPQVSRGSARDALRHLFSEEEEVARRPRRPVAYSFDGRPVPITDDAVIDLRDRSPGGDRLDDDAVIDLRNDRPGEGPSADLESTPAAATRGLSPAEAARLDTGTADPVGAALVHWYATRHVIATPVATGSRLG